MHHRDDQITSLKKSNVNVVVKISKFNIAKKKTIIEMCQNLNICENDKKYKILLKLTTINDHDEKNLSEFSFTLLKKLRQHFEHDININVMIINKSNNFKTINELG